MNVSELIERLNLAPHPEGGYFKETYRSDETLSKAGLPPGYSGPRNVATAIYYLLTEGDFSAMHRICSDEIFHFYLGDPVALFTISPEGLSNTVTLGPSIHDGELLQAVVRRGDWQGLCLKPGGAFALLGTTVAPGFDFEDFEIGERQALIKQFPRSADVITRLTRSP